MPGDPLPKQRPRSRVIQGRVVTYTPKETVWAEKAVALAYRARFSGPPLPGRFGITAIFYTDRRTDLDNLLKLVMDALSKVAWRDDRQVIEIRASKKAAGVTPRSEITLWTDEGEWR